MKQKAPFLVVMTVALTVLSCGGSEGNKGESGEVSESNETALPETFNTISIDWHQDRLMEETSEHVSISRDSGRWELSMTDDIQSIAFGVTQEELDDLYGTIRKNRFDKIKTRKEDNANPFLEKSVFVNVDGKGYGVSESEGMVVEDQYKDSWSEVLGAIYSLHRKKLTELFFDVQLILDKSIRESEHNISLIIGGVLAISEDENGESSYFSRDDSILVPVLPGQNIIQFGLYSKDSTDQYGIPENYFFFQESELIGSETSKITLSFNDSGELQIVQE